MCIDTQIIAKKKSSSFRSPPIPRFSGGGKTPTFQHKPQPKNQPEFLTSKFFAQPGNLPHTPTLQSPSNKPPLSRASLFSSPSQVTLADDRRKESLKNILFKGTEHQQKNSYSSRSSLLSPIRDGQHVLIAREFAVTQRPPPITIDDDITSQTCMSSMDPKMFLILANDKNSLGWLPVVFSLNCIISLYSFVYHTHHHRRQQSNPSTLPLHQEIPASCCYDRVLKMITGKHLKALKNGLRCFSCLRPRKEGDGNPYQFTTSTKFFPTNIPLSKDPQPSSQSTGSKTDDPYCSGFEEEEMFLVTKNVLDYIIAELDTKICVPEQRLCFSGMSIKECLSLVSQPLFESGGVQREFGVWMGELTKETGRDYTTSITAFRAGLMSALSSRQIQYESPKKTKTPVVSRKKTCQSTPPSQKTPLESPPFFPILSNTSTPPVPKNSLPPLVSPPLFDLSSGSDTTPIEEDINRYLAEEYQSPPRSEPSTKRSIHDITKEAIQVNEELTEIVISQGKPRLPSNKDVQIHHLPKRKRSYEQQLQEEEERHKLMLQSLTDQHENQVRLLRLLIDLEKETRDICSFKPPVHKKRK